MYSVRRAIDLRRYTGIAFRTSFTATDVVSAARAGHEQFARPAHATELLQNEKPKPLFPAYCPHTQTFCYAYPVTGTSVCACTRARMSPHRPGAHAHGGEKMRLYYILFRFCVRVCVCVYPLVVMFFPIRGVRASNVRMTAARYRITGGRRTADEG